MSVTYPPEMLPLPDEGETGVVIVGGQQVTSTAQPTCELRWQVRCQAPTFATAHSHTARVLQQRWQVTDYLGGKPIGVFDEWRDVPTATA